jgi:prepilin-type processing-associated H-X9-DG protein
MKYDAFQGDYMNNTSNVKRIKLVDLFAIIVIVVVLIAVLRPIFAPAREWSGPTCLSRQRGIAASIAIYADDHKGILPPAAIVWQSIKVDPILLICPAKRKLKSNCYGYPAVRSGKKINKIANPAKALVCADIKEGDPMRNGNIIFTMNDIDMRHSGHAVCAFVDGHVANETDIGKNDIPVK